jgi:hypothetical protein
MRARILCSIRRRLFGREMDDAGKHFEAKHYIRRAHFVDDTSVEGRAGCDRVF